MYFVADIVKSIKQCRSEISVNNVILKANKDQLHRYEDNKPLYVLALGAERYLDRVSRLRNIILNTEAYIDNQYTELKLLENRLEVMLKWYC